MLIFPLIHTQRLTLRKLKVEDFDQLVSLANNKNVSQHIINIPYPFREPDAVFRLSAAVNGFKNRNKYLFAIVNKQEGKLIGEIGLTIHQDPTQAELGYWIGEPYWNHGYMTEAIATVTDFGFSKVNLKVIYASVHSENIGSIKVLEKNQFSQQKSNNKVLVFARLDS